MYIWVIIIYGISLIITSIVYYMCLIINHSLHNYDSSVYRTLAYLQSGTRFPNRLFETVILAMTWRIAITKPTSTSDGG